MTSPAPAALRPTASVVVSNATTRVAGLDLRRDAVRAEGVAQRVGLRCPHPHTRSGLVSQIAQRGLGDQSSAGDDDDVVDGLGDLGQEVAGHEHRASLVGVGTKEPSQPVHAFGVETVGRLIEDQHVGLPEQGGRQPEALAHAQREPLDPSTSRHR